MNRYLYRLKRYFTLDGYSLSPIYIQLIILMIISFIIMGIASLYYGSFENSYYLFMSPTRLPPKGSMVVTIIIIIVGIIISSFVISILSSALEKFIGEVKMGILPFKRSNHLVIINQNSELIYILSELNIKYRNLNQIKELVLILSSEDEVNLFLQKMRAYKHLSIFVKYGNLYDVKTYQKFSLHKCENIMLLQDEKIDDKFLCDNNNLKILSTIIQHKTIDFKRINLVVQNSSTNGVDGVDGIFPFLQQSYHLENLSFINPTMLLGQLLKRSFIDVTYFNIYNELFTFQGFELCIVKAKRFIDSPIRFGDLLIKTNISLLIGCIQGNEVKLNEMALLVDANDELIFIAQNEREISPDSQLQIDNIPDKSIHQPSELANRKICILGDYLQVNNVSEFLDKEGQKALTTYNFTNFNRYTNRKFIDDLRAQRFDRIILNFEDKYTLRYILILVSLYGKEDSFVTNCISHYRESR